MEISFDEYEELKNLYENANKENEETFIFKGQVLLTQYAKYLIEYIESKIQ